jgi:hypothetical protein
MMRKRRSEAVARLNRASDAESQALRDGCALACLTHVQDIVAAYERAAAALEEEGIDDRAVDLWSPLVAIALVGDAEDGGGRARELLDLARELGSARDAEVEAGPTARLLEALDAIRGDVGETPTPSELLGALQARAGWDWVKNVRRLAGLLNLSAVIQ